MYCVILDIEELEKSTPDSNKISDTHKIETLERKLKEKDVHIEHLIEQINQMRKGFNALIERSETNESTSETTPDELKDSEQTHVAKIPMKEDESYFVTYAHFDIHYDMLSVSLTYNIHIECI